MKRSITQWTTTLATAALLGLPAVGAAQAPQPQATPPPATQPPTTQPPATQPPAEPSPTEQPPAAAAPQPQGDAVSPQEHLRQAKAALDAIQPTAITGRGRTQLTELKRHLNALEKASASPSGAAETKGGSTPPAAPGTKARSTANWGTRVAAIDKILNDLIATGAGAAPGPTGTSGTRSKAATAVSLDEATRAKLMDVRTHIVAYAAAMSGGSGTPKSEEATTAAAPAPSAATPEAGNAAAPAASSTPGATPPSAAPSAPTPSPETPQAAGAQPVGAQAPAGAQPPAGAPPPAGAQPPAGAAPQPAAASAQGDPEAARSHLTAARETLNQLTKLPAAAQLTGEARNQVAQLITNFNELITSQSQWRASYAKVAANLNALIGPDASSQSAAAAPAAAPEATPPAGATPPATATPGAVGTSGAANVDLDPAIREKLVELRRNLKEFEKAAVGAEQK
jgi:hypothetical protein